MPLIEELEDALKWVEKLNEEQQEFIAEWIRGYLCDCEDMKREPGDPSYFFRTGS